MTEALANEKRDDAAVRAIYAARLAARRADARRSAQLSRALSGARVASALLVIALVVAAMRWPAIPGALALAPAVVFLVLVAVHERVARAGVRAALALRFYENGAARLDDEWIGRGEGGERFQDAHHPYAVDLDLFGRGSLYELLNTARTAPGQETLARWLLAPAPVESITQRHEAVAELCDRLDLREDCALAAEDFRVRGDADSLARWGEAAPALSGRAWRIACLAMPLVTIATLVLWGVGRTGPTPLLGAVVAQTALAMAMRRGVALVTGALDRPAEDLALLARVTARLEAEPCRSALLTNAQAALGANGRSASRRIAQLRRLVDLRESGRNQMFAPIAALLLWDANLAWAIEGWRRSTGPHLREWLHAVGTIEALNALAGHAYENPSHTTPAIVAGDPRVDATALGHPLLPRGRCVRNDLRLDATTRVLVVSGSNMSGKSTLLRAVGVNAVLAFAGARVRARALTLSPLAVGASIVVVDSLQEGSSRFYAELHRMRQIVDAARERPTLFLLDEVFHGTNSHDRGIGVEAVVRELIARGAIGLVTTHDLAIAALEDALAPLVRNVHFVDHLEDGRMTFDYRMHPGVVQRSNALELMRAVGLAV